MHIFLVRRDNVEKLLERKVAVSELVITFVPGHYLRSR